MFEIPYIAMCNIAQHGSDEDKKDLRDKVISLAIMLDVDISVEIEVTKKVVTIEP